MWHCSITELLVRKADSLLSLQELEEKTETIYAKAQSLKGEKEGKKKKNKKQKRKVRAPNSASKGGGMMVAGDGNAKY